jgi:D-beta-D-heptose 7-phosphate kinase/D-beta-D-heptose 1-phosphate adenosyltransferase
MKCDIEKKIFTGYEPFASLLQQWRTAGEEVVFTNGCFDLVHHGHVNSLMQSAALGTRLIVGLNSDLSVRRLKGEGRPLLGAMARAVLLAAFACVDAVVIFEEDTPADLIARIVPDVLVKGSEYQVEEIAGFDTVLASGGRVERLELVPGISTSELIERIKKLD